MRIFRIFLFDGRISVSVFHPMQETLLYSANDSAINLTNFSLLDQFFLTTKEKQGKWLRLFNEHLNSLAKYLEINSNEIVYGTEL